MVFGVAVAGAGPAGATAALTLARRGLSVALLERDALPRYKTCGGGLVGRALALLPPEVERVVERRCGQADLHLLDVNQHYRATRDPPSAPIVATTMRERLDHVLASAAAGAGAALRAPCAVTGVTLEPRHVRLDTNTGPVTAAFVIAADGATGEVAPLAGGVTAGGIGSAGRRGRPAADAIVARGLDPPRARAGYHKALRPMLAELRVARMLARLLYEHPRPRRWVFRRVGQRLVEAITDVFMGARTYRGSVAGLAAALALRPSTRS